MKSWARPGQLDDHAIWKMRHATTEGRTDGRSARDHCSTLQTTRAGCPSVRLFVCPSVRLSVLEANRRWRSRRSEGADPSPLLGARTPGTPCLVCPYCGLGTRAQLPMVHRPVTATFAIRRSSPKHQPCVSWALDVLIPSAAAGRITNQVPGPARFDSQASTCMSSPVYAAPNPTPRSGTRVGEPPLVKPPERVVSTTNV